MLEPVRPIRVVSGGQTGVDRAALDAALALGLACGGWVPHGRRAEDGPLPARYPLREARTAAYGERTRLNVRDSDGTLVLTRGAPSGGTALTVAVARALRRPAVVVDLDDDGDGAAVLAWIEESGFCVLNVAGPRESTSPGIYRQARAYLDPLFAAWLNRASEHEQPDARPLIGLHSPDRAR